MANKKIFVSPDLEKSDTTIEEFIKLGYDCFTDEKILKEELVDIIVLPLNRDWLLYTLKNLKKVTIPTLYIGSKEDLTDTDFDIINKLGNIEYTESLADLEKLNNKILETMKKYKCITKSCGNNIWFKSILNATTEGIIAIDWDRKIKYMNPVAQQIVGIEYFNAVGKDATEIINFRNPNDLEILTTNWEVNHDQNFFEAELYNRVTKIYNNISGNISTVRGEAGNIIGKVVTIKDIGEIKSLFNRVKYHSSHDSLTGLLNRQSFIDSAEELITLSKYDESTHGLLVIALDKFKVVNDTAGHIAGDELLRKVSYLIRDIDKGDNFIKARIGGDEFGILFKNRSLSEIKHFTKSIKRRISKQDFIWGDKEFPILSSFGIVVIDKLTRNHHALLAAADDACTIAKEKGGNKIEIYNNVIDEYNKRRGEILWIHRLKKVINKKQLLLYYQVIEPVIKEDFKKIEILVRLKEENGILISPGDFIPPAERYGIMPEIDKIVIEKSIEACKKIIEDKSIKENYIFSVNISGTSIPDTSLPGFILSLFQKYKVPPTLFCFEITETATIKNLDLAKSFINNLKRVGCQFSLDDFGSGFSNFAYLRNLNVDYLKIDGSFIKDIIDEPINRAMVESINNIGHIMKMKTIAEFVENREIKEELIKLGVDYLQGYNISEPSPIDQIFNKQN